MSDSPMLRLVRHGLPEGVIERAFLGSTDLPLGQIGAGQAERLAAWIDGRFPIRSLLCSPLARARQTMAPIAARLGLPVTYHDDLREVDCGAWEMLTFPQAQARDPELIERWASGDTDFAFPGGERLADFAARMARASELVTSADAPLVVCHGGVIRALLCRWLNLPPTARHAFQALHATLTEVRWYGDAGVLEGFNLGP